MKNSFLFALLILTIFSCTVNEEPTFIINGLKPVYVVADESLIKSTSPIPIENAGNLLLFQDQLFIVERFKGIHVFDNSDPTNPINTAFIVLPGVSQLTLDGHILFVNYGKDLLMLDISDIENIAIVNRISNFYNESNNKFPENYAGYFECVDEALGNVVAWESSELENPKCFR